MSLWQALVFFVREALVSLRRSWQVSALAVVTIAVSLFIGGAFFLLTGNLTRVVTQWRAEAKVIAYLAEGSEEERAELRRRILSRGWITGVEEVSSIEAEERFTLSFPNLAELLTDWEGPSFPASFEVGYDPDAVEADQLSRWLRELEAEPLVIMVDDDRQWLRQVERLVALLRGIGLLLGGVLLAAAVFTISSVVRLTAYLYREEIAVLRLVGATEFMIRGPFLVEGLIQGVLGGALAVTSLFFSYRLIAARDLPSIFGSVLFDRFLPAGILLLLLLVGGLAGLFGAFISLRREETISGD